MEIFCLFGLILVLTLWQSHGNKLTEHSIQLIRIPSSTQTSTVWSKTENNFLICDFPLSLLIRHFNTTFGFSSLCQDQLSLSPTSVSLSLSYKIIKITLYTLKKLNSFPNINLLLYPVTLSPHAFSVPVSILILEVFFLSMLMEIKF